MSGFLNLIKLFDPSGIAIDRPSPNPDAKETDDPDLTEIINSHTSSVWIKSYMYQYPSDLSVMYGSDLLEKPYIMFRCKSSQDAGKTLGYIILYLPGETKTVYSADYGDLNRSIKRMTEGTIALATKATQAINKGGIDSVGDAAQEAIMTFASDTSLAKEFSLQKGKTVNPHMAQVFRNVNFRTFAFSFQMMARSEEEAKQIKKIIAAFKMGMHPNSTPQGEESEFWWQFPDNYDIKLYTPNGNGGLSADKMFKINTCALTDMTVDYGGSGIPSFFKDGHPVDIRMTLSFKELEVLTKDKIAKGY